MKYYTGNNTGDTPGNLPDPYYCKTSNPPSQWIERSRKLVQGGGG